MLFVAVRAARRARAIIQEIFNHYPSHGIVFYLE